MEPKTLDPTRLYNLQYTISGKPYIALPTASTRSIYLTEFYPADSAIVQSTLSIPDVYLHLIAIPQPYTLADAEWWIDLQLSGTSNLPLQVLRADDPETGLLIGSVSLMPPTSEALASLRDKMHNDMTLGENDYELGYYLHPDWRGNGIMKAAVKALLRWGKEEKGVKDVVVKILEGNLASRKIVEGMGEFVRESEKDDWIDWPEMKGGGTRRILAWRCKG